MSPDHAGLRIRSAKPTDMLVLRDMSFYAARWRPGQEVEDKDLVLRDDHVARYFEGWRRDGDLGVVAEIDGRPVGAAWLRLHPRHRPGYGFVDERTPELSIAVLPPRRGVGVGSALLRTVLDAARRAGHEAVSLSVEADNPALRLYERVGFRRSGRVGGSWTMLMNFGISAPASHPTAVVRRGYDAAAESYSAQRDPYENLEQLNRFEALLSPPATVLDVGCGSGVPIDRHLTQRGYSVIGIDLSPKQIDLARSSVPEARFEVADMLELDPEQYRVDGIVSFYAIFHTPRERHGDLLATLATFLGPGGAMLITMGAGEYEGREQDFHGVEMYWSHFGPTRNLQLVEEAGFAVVSEEIQDRGRESHQVILARRL